MGAHAFLPPSSAAIWLHCAAAPSMWQKYPEPEDSPSAAEGTAAHWVFAALMAPEHDVGIFPRVGSIAPNGVVVTQEMVEGAALFIEVVEEARAIPGLLDTCTQIEQRVSISNVHVENWGTPDAWIFGHNPTTGRARLVVADYKFGHGYVEVFENPQLLDYAAGILYDELKIDGAGDRQIDIEFVIVQPRSYHRDGPVRRWVVPADQCRAHFNSLRMAAEAATKPNPLASPGAARCKHCSARHACPALQAEAYASADKARDSLPLDLPTAALALEASILQEALGLLAARVSGLEEQIEYALRAGQAVPGWCLASEPGRTKWAREIGEIIALGQLCGADLSVPAVVTPTQARKLIDPAIVAAYSVSGAGALKLKQTNNSQARRVFGA